MICRVTALTVNERVPRGTRYPRNALMCGVCASNCIVLCHDDVLKTPRPDLSRDKDTTKQDILQT